MLRLRLSIRWLSAFGLVALFYGPLFAWSPITPGFVRTTLGAMVYLHRAERPLTVQHRRVPAEMRRLLERAIGLSFQGPVNVVRCDEPEDLTLVTDPDGWRPRFERQMGEPFERSLGRFERTLSRGRTAKPLA